MLRERARQVSIVIASLDLLLLVASFLGAWYIRAQVLPGEFDQLEYVALRGYVWLLLVSLPLFHMLFGFFGLYDSSRTLSYSKILVEVTKPFLVGGPILGSMVFLLQDKAYSRSIFVGFLLIFFSLAVLQRLGIKALQSQVRGRGFNTRDMVMVGVGREAAALSEVLARHAHLGMRVIGHLSVNGEACAPGIKAPLLGTVDDLASILDSRVVDEVFFAVPAPTLLSLEPHIWRCEEVGVRVHLKADIISTLLSRTYAGDIEGIPVLTLSPTPYSAGPMLVKRAMDFTIAGMALVLLSPLMVAIAIAIKLTSSGSVLHRQVRSGLHGRRFVLLKFRSMHAEAERQQAFLSRFNEVSGPVFKMRHDPRVTALGRYLRRFSLDELPQLWNILKGDMSFVGPRPPIPSEVEKYRRWQRRRLSMKPGLTCLWQINGRSGVDFETWMKLDMEYIDNWSLLLDLQILLKTIPVVLVARGAH